MFVFIFLSTSKGRYLSLWMEVVHHPFFFYTHGMNVTLINPAIAATLPLST